MDRGALLRQLNDLGAQQGIAPISQDEYNTVLSNLESKRVIITSGDEIYMNALEVQFKLEDFIEYFPRSEN